MFSAPSEDMAFFRAILVIPVLVAFYVPDVSEATPLNVRRGPSIATTPRATPFLTPQHATFSATTQRETPAQITQKETFDTSPQHSTPSQPLQPGTLDSAAHSATPTQSSHVTPDTTAQYATPVPPTREPVSSEGTISTPTSLPTPLETEMKRRKEKCGCAPIGNVSIGAVWKLELWSIGGFPPIIPTEKSILPSLSTMSTSSQTPSSTTNNPVLGSQSFGKKRRTGQDRRAKRECCRQVNHDEKNGQDTEEDHGARKERDINAERKVLETDDTRSAASPTESPFDEYERYKRQCCGQLDGSQKPCCGHLNRQEDPERKKRNCCGQASGEGAKPCCGQIDQDGKNVAAKLQGNVRIARQTSEYDKSIITPFAMFLVEDYSLLGCCGVQEGSTLDCCLLSSKDLKSECCFGKFIDDFSSSLDEIYERTLTLGKESPNQDIIIVPLYPTYDYITQ